jgi:hypothetical protein
MKGLSSGTLAKTASLAQPMPLSERWARSWMMWPTFDHGVHVDARRGRGQVQEAADALGLGEGLGDRVDEVLLGRGRPFLDHRAEPAQEVDVASLTAVSRALANLTAVIVLRGSGSSSSDAGVTEIRRFVIGMPYFCSSASAQWLSSWPFSTIRAWACLREPVQVPIDAVLQVDAQRDGADIEMMIQRHADGFKDLFERISA